MTTRDLLLILAFYFVLFVVVAYFTRARARRIVGAFAGGAVFGAVAIPALALGESQGWWRLPATGAPYFFFLLWLGFAVSGAPSYLLLWRIVRRFGSRGLAISVLAVAIIGPPRDYWIVTMFPKWMTFGPGLAPIFADATVYILFVLVGYAVMRLVAGPDKADALARS